MRHNSPVGKTIAEQPFSVTDREHTEVANFAHGLCKDSPPVVRICVACSFENIWEGIFGLGDVEDCRPTDLTSKAHQSKVKNGGVSLLLQFDPLLTMQIITSLVKEYLRRWVMLQQVQELFDNSSSFLLVAVVFLIAVALHLGEGKKSLDANLRFLVACSLHEALLKLHVQIVPSSDAEGDICQLLVYIPMTPCVLNRNMVKDAEY